MSNENTEEISGKQAFPEITKLLEENDNKIFEDASFYKNALEGGGEISKKLSAVFQKYSAAADPADKSVFRQQMTNAYWEYFSFVSKQICSNISDYKKYMLRFGMIHPGALAAENRSFFARIIDSSDLEQPVYYVDEWFKLVGRGMLKASTTDEIKPARGNEGSHLRSLLEKASGRANGIKEILKTKNAGKTEFENRLKAEANSITVHKLSYHLEEIDEPYSEGQKASLVKIQELLKSLYGLDREISRLLEEYMQCKEDVQGIQSKLDAIPKEDSDPVDAQAIETEYNSVRQMAKMTVGRQGNPFPCLNKDYFHSIPDNVGFRENIIKKLAWIEEADCEAFIRVFKNTPSRIVPYVILLPSYGDYGICWEPFDKLNKATSRGRIAIPMYPKSLNMAVLTAVGDFRWQVAKEIASMYWMEEGLTGNYFQWFQSQKLRGDVKLYFIQDYIAWMTKEREGVQKLDKNVRGIFWRYMPFSQPLKEKLKDRNLVYFELYQRDKNRMKSDGY